MPRKTQQQKIDFLYSLVERINEVSVVADRKGCGEVAYLIEGIVDEVAAAIGLPPSYRKRADDWRLVNEGIEELMEEYPEA